MINRSQTEDEAHMKQNSGLEAGFEVGERVRLIAKTLAWKAEMTLRGKTGEVIECRDDGRVSVRFDNGRLLLGRATAAFERISCPDTLS